MNNKFSPRLARLVLTLMVVFTLVGQSLPTEASPRSIGVGDCVKVSGSGSAKLAVRLYPGLNGLEMERLPDGQILKITGGPMVKNGFTWWRHNRGGWSVGNNLTFVPMSCPIVVLLDAGHGGSDAGASLGTLKEKDINLDVALKVKTILEQNGITVIMTRTGDTNPSLSDRLNKCNNQSNLSLFVSIHTNASDPGVIGTGPEGWYWSQANDLKSKILATKLSGSISSKTLMDDRGATPGEWAVTKCTKAASVLVELAFINAPSPYKDLYYLRYGRGTLASAVSDPILTWVGK